MMPSRPRFSASLNGFFPCSGQVLAVDEQGIFGQDRPQPLLAVDKRQAAQVLSI
jgi:hypothetical protein